MTRFARHILTPIAIVATGLGVAADDPPPVPDQGQAYYHYLQAQRHIQAQETEPAEERLRAAVRVAPEDADLRLEYARYLVHLRRLEEAHGQLEQCLLLNPDNPEVYRLRARMRRSVLGSGVSTDTRFLELAESALEDYRQLLTLRPDDVDGHFEIGRLYMTLGRLDDAKPHLERHNQLAGFTLEGAYYTVLLLVEREEHEQALPFLEQLEAARPGWLEIRQLRLEALMQTGHHAEAVEIGRRLVESHPDHPDARLALARALAAGGRPTEALAELDRARRDGLDHAGLLDLQGRLLRDAYRYDEALAAFRAAIDLEPGSLDAQFHLALTHVRRGDTLSAVQAFERLVAESDREGRRRAGNRRIFLLNLAFLQVEAGRKEQAAITFATLRREYPHDLNAGVYAQQADVLAGLGRDDEARAVLDEGLVAHPGAPELMARQVIHAQRVGVDPVPLLNALESRLVASDPPPNLIQALAGVYIDQDRWERVLTVLDQGLRHHPDHPGLLLMRGAALEKEKRYDEARRTFEAILEIDPEHATALNNLGYMLIDADLDVVRGVELVRRALVIEPENGAYLDSLGWGLFKLGQPKEALPLLKQAAARLPGEATILEHLGDVLRALGENHQARDHYRRAIATQTDGAVRTRLEEKIRTLRPTLQKSGKK